MHEHLQELISRKVVLENKVNSGQYRSEDRARLEHLESMIELNKLFIMIYLDEPPTTTLQ